MKPRTSSEFSSLEVSVDAPEYDFEHRERMLEYLVRTMTS